MTGRASAQAKPTIDDQGARTDGLDDRARVQALRDFARGARTLPILIQAEPDPDAIGSAFAVRVLLERNEKTTPIMSLGRTRRPETRRMIELLELPVTEVTEEELRAFERIIAVDLEPTVLNGSSARLAVIDHHPRDDGYEAEFADVRPEYGATATMLTEYLRADGHEPDERLATALLYGIRTDTALLTRGCTRADVEAYAYLQERADLALLNRIDRPAYPRDALAHIGHALAHAQLRDGLAVLWLGRMRKSRAHLMPELADLSLNIEAVRWVAVGGVVERALVINIRHLSENEPGAGALARHAAGAVGSGGGHATMARVEIPLDRLPFELEDEPEDEPGERNAETLADWIEGELNQLRAPAG